MGASVWFLGRNGWNARDRAMKKCSLGRRRRSIQASQMQSKEDVPGFFTFFDSTRSTHRQVEGMLRMMLQLWSPLFWLVQSGKENVVLWALSPSSTFQNQSWLSCEVYVGHNFLQLPTVPQQIVYHCSFLQEFYKLQTDRRSIHRLGEHIFYKTLLWNYWEKKHYKNSQIFIAQYWDMPVKSFPYIKFTQGVQAHMHTLVQNTC